MAHFPCFKSTWSQNVLYLHTKKKIINLIKIEILDEKIDIVSWHLTEIRLIWSIKNTKTEIKSKFKINVKWYIYRKSIDKNKIKTNKNKYSLPFSNTRDGSKISCSFYNNSIVIQCRFTVVKLLTIATKQFFCSFGHKVSRRSSQITSLITVFGHLMLTSFFFGFFLLVLNITKYLGYVEWVVSSM